MTLLNNGAKKEQDFQLTSYWDHRFQRRAIKILPGDYYATDKDEVIVTVLGSCISVCLFDTHLKTGGMNHFMLPASKKKPDPEPVSDSAVVQGSWGARYGNVAMELLMNELFKLGCCKKNLVAKIFGGASVTHSSIDVGQSNIQFVEEYLKLEDISIIGHDLGGFKPRKLYFIPLLNQVYVKLIDKIKNDTIRSREQDYRLQLELLKKEKNIVFFDEL